MPSAAIKAHWLSGNWLGATCKFVVEAGGLAFRRLTETGGNAFRRLTETGGNATRTTVEAGGNVDVGEDCP